LLVDDDIIIVLWAGALYQVFLTSHSIT